MYVQAMIIMQYMYVHVHERGNMGKFESDASKLLAYVGGKDNIKAVSHCVTRMRFVLIDQSKADV